MGGWLAWTSSLSAQNEEEEGPVNVELLYFTATTQADGVRLNWETATESDMAGYILQRSTDGVNFSTLNEIGFITATGGISTGAEYSALDEDVTAGQTYTYKLVEIETNSNQNDLETVTITYDPQPTATPIVIGGSNPTSIPATNTPVAKATTTPTKTPTNTPTATPISSQPTATPLPPTITPPPTATEATIRLADNSVAPTTAVQIADVQIDQAFASNSANAGSANAGVVMAQEEQPTAYPEPDTTAPAPLPDADSYPAGQEPQAEILTPYPARPASDAVPTLAVIGSSDPYPPEGTAPQSASAETIRGRIMLWAGFLIALFIFLSGIIGAIVLYRRQVD
jgi:hypothetical protein